ncbi:hypothetical protein BD414DRAFT_515051 [Trametes punicea]|nr:hypothetical protein BD414DRAFT_515051 [Trametes punicea]
MPAPFPAPAPSAAPVPLPALYLYPLNDSFVPKHISLVNNQRVKIGRQTNAKTVPQERNGYFDSKVLSRQHAEVWEENGKIFIKDVKSSNGTFINGERLSPEGLESEPYELKTDDIVEFGIDIVGEDNKTIVHHKVAARVVCVFTELDAQAAHRAEQQQQQQGAHGYLGGMAGQPGAGSNGAFNFASNGQGSSNGPGGAQRRPALQPQGLVGMGGMGGNVRVPGKSGLTFDHILSRLHGELQKSRETGAELHSLSSGLAEIHETLGGNFPPNLPPYPSTLPPVVPPQPGRPSEESHHEPQPEPSTAVSELQAQLQETQRSLADHVEKVRMLEGMLAEHQAIKQEVSSLRDAMEERKRDMELFRFGNRGGRRSHDRHGDEHDVTDEDDDDARSISTIVPHELEPVDEVDEEQVAAEEEEERRRRRDELGRPRTPEPTGMGMSEDEDDREHDQDRYGKQSVGDLRARSRSPQPTAASMIPDELTERLNALAKQLEMALDLSRSLEAQHASAQSTISVLEAKVASLENLVQVTQTQVQAQSEESEAARTAQHEPSVSAAALEEARVQERESLTAMFTEWKKNVEGRWSSVQEDWNDERERLRRAKEEWESRMRAAEETISGAASKVESGLLALASFQAQHQQGLMNGNAKPHSSGGLVTPPSPRSLSADSTRPRQRRKRVSSSRGRTRSRSVSPGAAVDEPKRDAPRGVDSSEGLSSGLGPRRRSPWAVDDSSDSEGHHPSDRSEQNCDGATQGKMPFPITPESSVVNQPISTAASVVSGATTDPRAQKPPKDGVSSAVVDSRPSPDFALQYPYHNFSTAVGVAVLAVAAVAVAWRVKPEVSV